MKNFTTSIVDNLCQAQDLLLDVVTSFRTSFSVSKLNSLNENAREQAKSTETSS